MDRRSFLGMLALGTYAALTGCTAAAQPQPSASPTPTATPTTAPSPTAPPTPAARALPPIPQPRPGPASVIEHAPAPTQQIALTVDDGYCQECVDGYVAFVQNTGIPITFLPNGTYRSIWEPQAARLRPLIEAGQVQISNHTYSHGDVTKLSDARIREELERNDDWIQSTFGITSRPYFRPPYGAHTQRTDSVAGDLGYTKITLWNGSFGDSSLLSAQTLMKLADQYLQPGTIMIGHANHPTILGLFDQIRQIMAERQLQPVTLDTMFGTSRATG